MTRIISFYLPQFHSIPENNLWWGDGFTEWTNVKPAQPQFHGHYQPHVPIDLGYYNLLNKNTQVRQITLAKEYGVYGFCFYFYWFAGKMLLETPVLNYLKDPALDLPFCLCWANENWSRRWDGMDHEILIAQSYSASDDINFITHIRQYLESGKYIRYEGKPLVVVYRPKLLPDAKATAYRWREWCRNNGVGEIHLAYVQSFEKVDPAVYGFDSAIEFPPSQFPQRKINPQSVMGLDPKFEGHIIDYPSLCRKDHDYKDEGYRLFRGSCPSWDNTARRKERGIIVKGSSPFHYLQWLRNAIAASLLDPRQGDEPMVFINAWNEWAEGAHLEPDERFGYAYLDATKMALATAEAKVEASLLRQDAVCIFLHLYYPEMLEEIICYLEELRSELGKIFVSCSIGMKNHIEDRLCSVGIPCEVIEVENRGRDILPFLLLLEKAIEQRFSIGFKIHTKKSAHRSNGSSWRQDMLQKLLTTKEYQRIVRKLSSGSKVGLVAPAGHLLKLKSYMGSNDKKVFHYGNRLGLKRNEIQKAVFPAGSMFAFKVAAMKPILALGMDSIKFEEEQGAIDGTIAHAIERLFGLSALACHQKVVTSRFQNPLACYRYASSG